MDARLQAARVGIAAIALVIIGALGANATAAEDACLGETVEALTADVPDARSVSLGDGRVLRLAGIEPFDLIAPDDEHADARLRERLEQLTGARQLSVQLLDTSADRYGRLPALVATAEGALVQELLIGAGLAVAFASGDPFPCFNRLLAAEEAARAAGRGGWSALTIPQATPLELKAWLGRFVIFEGLVLSVGNRRARTYLNFGERWSDDVTVEIEARDRKRFGGEEALAAFSGRRVRARGYLEAKSGPMMIVRSPTQLEVLGDNPSKTGVAP